MNYTLAYTEQPHDGFKVDICKSGNKYTVGIWYKETETNCTNTYDTIEDAYKVYEVLSRCIVFGEYSIEDRVNYLMTGVI